MRELLGKRRFGSCKSCCKAEQKRMRRPYQGDDECRKLSSLPLAAGPWPAATGPSLVGWFLPSGRDKGQAATLQFADITFLS